MTIGQRFLEKRAFVTGAASGMGQAIALRILEEGGKVTATDISAAGLAETEKRAAEVGAADRVVVAELDVADEAAVEQVVGGAIARDGGLDVLINAAGVLRAVHTEDCTTDFWETLIRVNLTGTFMVTRAALRALLESKGVVVNFSSTSAFNGHPYMAAYAASKGGIAAFTQTLASEYAKQGLRAVAVAPGGIETQMVTGLQLPEDADYKNIGRLMPLLGRFGSPEDVAGIVATLASDEGRHVTGVCLRIDAGTHC